MQYILYIHGVTERKADFYKQLDCLVTREVARLAPKLEQTMSISLFWGLCSESRVNASVKLLQNSAVWSELSFKRLREKLIFPFGADAALYMNPEIGANIVNEVCEQAIKQLKDFNSNSDCIHLVSHSWGTVILFDILFSDRWLNESTTCSTVRKLRDILCTSQGVNLSSIHTMGSPIALFSLMDSSSNDLSSKQRLAEILLKIGSWRDKPLEWINYLHEDDPIAWPIEGVFPGSEELKIFDVVLGKYHAFELHGHILKIMEKMAWFLFRTPLFLVFSFVLSLLLIILTAVLGFGPNIGRSIDLWSDHLLTVGGWSIQAAMYLSVVLTIALFAFGFTSRIYRLLTSGFIIGAHSSYWRDRVVANAIADCIIGVPVMAEIDREHNQN